MGRTLIAIAALGAAGCTAPRMTLLLNGSRQPVPMTVVESSVSRHGNQVHVELRAFVAAGYEGAVTAHVSLDGTCGQRATGRVDFDRPYPPHATESVLTIEFATVRCEPGVTIQGSLWGRSAFVLGWALIEPFVIAFHDLELKASTAP